MREILFRGKRIDNGEWVYGGCAVTENQVYLIYNQAHSIDLQGFTVDENTIGQYTGLTDKNGKKIFEGDIVKYFRYGNHGDSRVAYVTYSCKDTAYQLADGKTVCMNIGAWFYSDELEVIGNIHDNHELMEDKP